MTLIINTAQNNLIELSLKNKDRLVASKKISSRRTQAEKLLPALEKFLKTAGLKLSDIKRVEVAGRGGSFTSLRVGVVTANALAYALGIRENGRLKIVKPEYGSEPVITVKKRGLVVDKSC